MGAFGNMSAFGLRRRNLVLASCAVLLVFVLFYSQPQIDSDRIKNLIPGHGDSHGDGDDSPKSPTTSTGQPVSGADDGFGDVPDVPNLISSERPDDVSTNPDDGSTEEAGDVSDSPTKKPGDSSSKDDKDNKDGVNEDATSVPHFGALDPTDSTKVSHLHFLLPASNSNIEFCVNLVSSVVNRYSPFILGLNATGIYDAHESHLAKMHTIDRYLAALPASDDDDLVLIVDGYDVIMQLPAEVVIERYFDIAYKADERLAKRFGLSVEEARKQNIRQTVFWGPDKICWPNDGREPRCWAVPVSGLPHNAFGPKTGNGEMYYSDPRWLNSGTVIGPVTDVRRLIKATLREIEETYDEKFTNSESDQYYISNIWGRQEYWRSAKAAAGKKVVGGPSDRFDGKQKKDEHPEFHISIDYESNLFQTKAGYEPFFGYLQFNQSDMNAKQTRDMFEEGADYEPYDIQMPPNVVAALSRIYDDIPDAHPGSRGSDWIRDIPLGANFVTRHIYALWHCTASKQWIKGEYKNLWFYPFAKPLVEAAIKAGQTEELLTEAHIDGRRWATKFRYPEPKALPETLGGAWTDYDDLSFVPWNEMCGEFNGYLFEGDEK